MDNEAVGRSGMIWDGTTSRRLSLMATTAQLTSVCGGSFAVIPANLIAEPVRSHQAGRIHSAGLPIASPYINRGPRCCRDCKPPPCYLGVSVLEPGTSGPAKFAAVTDPAEENKAIELLVRTGLT